MPWVCCAFGNVLRMFSHIFQMTTTSPKPFTWAEQDNAELSNSNVWNLLIEQQHRFNFMIFILQWLNAGGVFHFCRLWASQCHLQRGASTRVRITFTLPLKFPMKLLFQLCWDCCHRRLCWCHPWGGGASLKTQTYPLKIWTWQRLVMIYTFQPKFRFYTWSQTRVTRLPFPLPFPQ